MSDQHTVYYADEEENLKEWVERYEEVLGGRSDFIKRALRLMRKEHGDKIESLSDDTEGSDKLI